ncbi:sulfatase [Haloferula helveola]|uniref:sulfatase family protein n=1 Tax=Haloferula helveola TaxID=490095 RepID=UPI0030A8910B
MSGAEVIPKPRGRLGAALGIGVFLAYQYGHALWRLANGSGSMDSKFSRVAIDDYRSYLIGQNLMVLIAYVLVGMAAWLLLMPLVDRVRNRWKSGWSAFGAGLVGASLLHGYFMFRLVHSRPYFTGDAAFGSWYYGVLELPPVSWRPLVNGLLFDALPWAMLLGVIFWWFSRMGNRGRLAVGSMIIALAVTGFVNERGWRAAASATATSEGQPPNVIIIGSDSLRGDRLGYAGYRPGRTDGPAAAGVSPEIDTWSESAAVFEVCRTPIGSTLESGVSVMSSTYPHTHGLRQMFASREQIEAVRDGVTPIASLLSQRGYDTAAIGDWCAGFYELTPLGFEDIDVSSFDSFQIYVSQAVVMAHFVVPLYFDNALGYHLFPQIRSFAQFVTPEVVTRRVEERIRSQASSGRPFFWSVFYSCNHLPYRAAEPYCRMFGDPDYRGPNATGVDFDIDAFIGGTDVESKWSALPEKEAKQIRALYDGCTRQFDHCFGRIIDSLEENGLLENTIVVLTADHGDDLYEPGVTLGHGLGFNGADASYHVPLAIRVPGNDGQRFDEQVRTIDLAPTLAGLLDVPIPEEWEGRSLKPWLDDPEAAADRAYYGETQFPFIHFKVPGVDRPELPPMDGLTRVAPEFNHQFVLRPEYLQPLIDAKQRCLRTRDWKLVCTPDVDGKRHFGLFHTRTDPDSLEDLAEERPEVVAPMRRALEAWIDDHAETQIDGIFPDGEPAGPER